MQIIMQKVGLITMYIQKSKIFSLGIQIIAGFIFVSAFGCLLHFFFEWTSENHIIAAFSPVNESTWEHLKLVYYPILFFLIIQLIYLKNKRTSIPNLIWFTALSALLAMLLTTVIYYTYIGITGKNTEWFNIAIFFISVCVAYIFNYNMIKSRTSKIHYSSLCGILIFIVLGAALITFTYFPPHIPWFADPVSGSFGLE